MTISVIALIVLIIILLVTYWCTSIKKNKCEIEGHKWHATEDGYICERCKISYESDGWL